MSKQLRLKPEGFISHAFGDLADRQQEPGYVTIRVALSSHIEDVEEINTCVLSMLPSQIRLVND